MRVLQVLLGAVLSAGALLEVGAQPAQGGLVVAGTVEDSAGAPLRDVQLVILGTDAQTATDARGRFRLMELRPGSFLLRVRRLGFEPVLVPLELPLANDAPLAIELRESAADLTPVVVKANAVSARLAATGFENRRQNSGAPPSQFVTRADLERYTPQDLSQMLRRMGGRATRCADGIIFVDGVLMAKPIADAVPSATQATQSLMNSPNPSTATSAARTALQDIAKTGTPPPKPPALDMIPQNWIEGMEVYASPAQIPNEYRAAFREARCVILLWTR